MTFNRFLYNSALWNAGREEAGAVARSIIQAHTGPHIQAVVGSESGVSLISDFIITEGVVNNLPHSFKFPDLTARVNAVFPGRVPYLDRNPFLSASIRGIRFRDLSASVFLVDHTPDLGGRVFGLFEATLAAFIEGRLGEKDLGGTIFGTALDLSAVINALLDGSFSPFAPSLPGRMLGISAPTLGAMIHAPLDLAASLSSVQRYDLLSQIRGFQVALLGGSMLGIPTPQLFGFIRGYDSGTGDLVAGSRASPIGAGLLEADVNPVFTGDTGFGVGLRAVIEDTITFGHSPLSGYIRGAVAEISSLTAVIKTGGSRNLSALISLLGADNLPALVSAVAFADSAKNLSALAGSVHPADLLAVMTINENVSFLAASIFSLRGTHDLPAFIRVAETFVTAVMNVSTMSAQNLRAVVGRPDCLGGSASYNLTAVALAQFVGNLSAYIESWATVNLGASVNTSDIFHSLDSIPITFTTRKVRNPSSFKACDQISVLFSPFRGNNLGASILGVLRGQDLSAIVTATFPLLSVVPAINRLTVADIKDLDDFDLQEIRLQMEGDLTEFFYVSGTGKTFARDANENWKINIRSFRPIADNLFGEFAAARVCRLGSLESFHTIDAAVRFCIQAVIGFTSRSDMGASVTALGQIAGLNAQLSSVTNFHDLASQLYPTTNPSSVTAYINGMNAALAAYIRPINIPATSSVAASIAQVSVNNLVGDITGSFAAGSTGAGTLGLGATVPHALQTSILSSLVGPFLKTKSLVLSGVAGEYAEAPSLQDIGWVPGSKLTVAVWVNHDSSPVANAGVVGNTTDSDRPTSGFGIRWVSTTDLEFYVNGTANTAQTTLEYPEAWQFIVGVYDPTLGSDNLKIYTEYGRLGSVTGDHTLPVGNITSPIFLGKTSKLKSGAGNEIHATGNFHELMVWDEALSQDAIQELAADPPGKIAKMSPSVDAGDYTSSDKLLLHWDMEELDVTAPVIQPAPGVTTVPGVLVNLSGSDVISNVSPSFPRGAVNGEGSTYWFPSTSSQLPYPSGYTGSLSIWSVCTFANGNPLSVWGLGNSAQNTGVPFRLIKSAAGGGELTMEVNDSALTQYTVVGPAVAEDDTVWYSSLVTYDATTRTATLFVNSIDYGSVTLSTTRQSTDESAIAASFFGSNDNTSRANGRMEAFGYWDRVLSSGEMDILFDLSAEPILVNYPTLVTGLTAWYRPGEANDAGMSDMSVNGKHLTRAGSAPTWVSQTYVE